MYSSLVGTDQSAMAPVTAGRRGGEADVRLVRGWWDVWCGGEAGSSFAADSYYDGYDHG